VHPLIERVAVVVALLGDGLQPVVNGGVSQFDDLSVGGDVQSEIGQHPVVPGVRVHEGLVLLRWV